METCLNYTDADNKMMWFSSDERRWINKIRRLSVEYPLEVTVIHQPETNDGCIVAKIPVSFPKISPKKRVTMSEEQLTALRDAAQKRLKNNDTAVV